MAKRLLRKGLSAPGLLREVRACFEELDDPVSSRGLCLAESLMSGLAVFGLKYPSLLQFDRDAKTDEVVRANLRRLYGIERAPCDTALRECLDEVDPRQLRPVFKRVFARRCEGCACPPVAPSPTTVVPVPLTERRIALAGIAVMTLSAFLIDFIWRILG